MFNQFTAVGNLTREIELKHTQSGSAIGNTAIATSHKYKTQSGEMKEETMFIDLTFFGRAADIASQYLRKGSKIFVTGRIKLEMWKAQDGTNRSKHVVIVDQFKFLDSKPANGQAPQQHGNNGYKQNQNPPAYNANGQASKNYDPNPKTTTNGVPVHYEAQQQQTQQAPTAIDINEDDMPF